MVEALMIPHDALWSTLKMYTQPYPSDLLQHVRPYHEFLFSCKPHRPGCHQWKPVHLQVYDEIRDLQPDVIVERYLDAKYYQHPPDRVKEMSEYNSNATYLATSDQIMTLNAMETDDTSVSATVCQSSRQSTRA